MLVYNAQLDLKELLHSNVLGHIVHIMHIVPPLSILGLGGVKRGKKRNALFQTHNWEKSSFFSILVPVFVIYRNFLVH